MLALSRAGVIAAGYNKCPRHLITCAFGDPFAIAFGEVDPPRRTREQSFRQTDAESLKH
jgi:hypothetical protein